MLTLSTTLRVQLLLSVQRALLDVVVPALRAVVLRVEQSQVLVNFYVDGDPRPHRDDFEGVATEMQADMDADSEVVVEAVVTRIDSPTPWPQDGLVVFARRE